MAASQADNDNKSDSEPPAGRPGDSEDVFVPYSQTSANPAPLTLIRPKSNEKEANKDDDSKQKQKQDVVRNDNDEKEKDESNAKYFAITLSNTDLDYVLNKIQFHENTKQNIKYKNVLKSYLSNNYLILQSVSPTLIKRNNDSKKTVTLLVKVRDDADCKDLIVLIENGVPITTETILLKITDEIVAAKQEINHLLYLHQHSNVGDKIPTLYHSTCAQLGDSNVVIYGMSAYNVDLHGFRNNIKILKHNQYFHVVQDIIFKTAMITLEMEEMNKLSHGDIKPENILLKINNSKTQKMLTGKNNQQIKQYKYDVAVCDFGLSINSNHHDQRHPIYSPHIGTKLFTPKITSYQYSFQFAMTMIDMLKPQKTEVIKNELLRNNNYQQKVDYLFKELFDNDNNINSGKMICKLLVECTRTEKSRFGLRKFVMDDIWFITGIAMDYIKELNCSYDKMSLLQCILYLKCEKFGGSNYNKNSNNDNRKK